METKRPMRTKGYSVTTVLSAVAALAGWAGVSLLVSDSAGKLQSTCLSVVSDEEVLSRRVRLTGSDTLQIDAPHIDRADRETHLTLVLRAEIDPPEIDKVSLQASHVTLREGRAYVSYNVAGPAYRGGIDVFDTSRRGGPRLVSLGLFRDTDVSAAAYDSGRLYLATATSDETFASPAVLAEIMLDSGRLTPQCRRRNLPSYVATSVAIRGGQIFATSGSGGPGGGGLYVFDRSTLTLEEVDRFLDARSVDVSGDRVVALRGTPGQLRIFDGSSNELTASYDIGGANVPESKSTVQIVGHYAFVAAGDEGLKVVDLDDGSVAAELPATAVSPDRATDVVTNGVSVSVNGKLVFMANGGGGLVVLRTDRDLSKSDGDFHLTLIGRVIFRDVASVNDAASTGRLLFATMGSGGVKVIEIVSGDNPGPGGS